MLLCLAQGDNIHCLFLAIVFATFPSVFFCDRKMFIHLLNVSFLWDHWHPYFGLLLTSAPGFNVTMDPLACILPIYFWVWHQEQVDPSSHLLFQAELIVRHWLYYRPHPNDEGRSEFQFVCLSTPGGGVPHLHPIILPLAPCMSFPGGYPISIP